MALGRIKLLVPSKTVQYVLSLFPKWSSYKLDCHHCTLRKVYLFGARGDLSSPITMTLIIILMRFLPRNDNDIIWWLWWWWHDLMMMMMTTQSDDDDTIWWWWHDLTACFASQSGGRPELAASLSDSCTKTSDNHHRHQPSPFTNQIIIIIIILLTPAQRHQIIIIVNNHYNLPMHNNPLTCRQSSWWPFLPQPEIKSKSRPKNITGQ